MKLDNVFLRSEYNRRKPNLERFLEQVKLLLQQELNRKKIKIHSLPCRVKPLSSFLDKSHRKKINDPFREMHDLAALRIVCLYLTDLEKIGSFIRDRLVIIDEDNKIDDTESNVFEYMSLHYKAKLKKPISNDQPKELRDFIFEIQVRTISQDAWASISHHLDYKQEDSLSSQSKRDFNALSGLFYVADTHFSMLKKEKEVFFNKNLKSGKNITTTT